MNTDSYAKRRGRPKKGTAPDREDRLALIRALLDRMGRILPSREMARLLSEAGYAVSHVQVSKDYRKLQLAWGRSAAAKARGVRTVQAPGAAVAVDLSAEKVLVVEAPEVQVMVERILAEAGIQAISCTAQQAPELLETGKICLLVANRPEMLQPFRPELRILYISGMPDPAVLGGIQNRAVAVLRKPFTPEEFLSKVRDLIAIPTATAAEVRYRATGAGLRVRLGAAGV